MRLRHVAVIGLLAGSLLAGCRSQSRPADEATLRAVREAYAQIDPQAQVGLVIATLPESGLVSVGDIPVAGVEIGDVLVLMDSQQKIIGAGHVVNKTDTALHLSYDVNEKGREPQVGDLAVKSAAKQ